ncbi:MAG: efflux RND transporter periplasmic adaptor subunit [Thermodesulfobacteriota bacterium]
MNGGLLRTISDKRYRKPLLVALAILIAFVAGYYLSGGGSTPRDKHADQPATETSQQKADKSVPPKETAKATLWTCSMHPQIKLPNPGKCPICFMDLIPLETGTGPVTTASLTQYSMSETAKKLAEVQTSPVKREQAKLSLNMVGMVFEDETRVAFVPARVDGRLDELYVNFTGVMVNEGDPMVKIWSPTLIKSQVELFESTRTKEVDPEVVKGAEEKLMQQGLTREQVDEIKAKQKPILYVTLRAPIKGVVMKKMAILGQFVKEGQEMYMINDLSRVWVKLDAYETDMPWIRYGQDVTFTTPSVPGKTFKGRVLFIDPVLDTKTRSVKVRVEADNPDLSLRPGMFVSARLEAEVDAQGRVIKSEWAGKYICPVHPSDTPSDTPGICPESKMELKPASAFGYVDDKNPVHPLIIPAGAPLITGKRSIVYVELPKTEQPTYELREVVLGPKTADKYVVYEGLKEGERVVAHGNFKIDSAMQILARSSMMHAPDVKPSPTPPQPAVEEELVEKVEAPAEFLNELTPGIKEYLALKEALVEAKLEDATKAGEKLAELLKSMKTDKLEGKAQETWKKLSDSIASNLKGVIDGTDVELKRRAFGPLSEDFVRLLMAFRHTMAQPLVIFHCPMAFNKQGAYWVEGSEERRNPYFGRTPFKGQDMLQCAELVEKIPPEKSAALEKSAQERPASTEPEKHDQEGQKKAGSEEGGSHSQHEGDAK